MNKIIKCYKCGKVLKGYFEQFEFFENKKWNYICEKHYKIEMNEFTSLHLIEKIQNETSKLCWRNLDMWIEILEERFNKKVE